MNNIAPLIKENEARVTITFNRQQGDMTEPVSVDATDGDVLGWVQEAIRNGSVPGIDAAPDASFRDFVVDRFPPAAGVPFNRMTVRPKTAFGADEASHLELNRMLDAIKRDADQYFGIGQMRCRKTLQNGAKVFIRILMPNG